MKAKEECVDSATQNATENDESLYKEQINCKVKMLVFLILITVIVVMNWMLLYKELLMPNFCDPLFGLHEFDFVKAFLENRLMNLENLTKGLPHDLQSVIGFDAKICVDMSHVRDLQACICIMLHVLHCLSKGTFDDLCYLDTGMSLGCG